MAKMPSFEPSAVHSRSAQIKATAAITVLVLFCISAYSLFGHQIIREIYDGGAASIFQKKLSESRALEFYLGKADRIIYAYGALLFAACLTALTFLFKTWKQTPRTRFDRGYRLVFHVLRNWLHLLPAIWL